MAYERRYRDELDTDDEYERAGLTSPALQGDYSPTNSDATEHTPTYSRPKSEYAEDSIVHWTAEQCADFISTLGMEQYAHSFIDEDINGEALVELQHLDLKDLGVLSVGHRLTILKGVYNQKIEQNVPIAPDHYVPLSADANAPDAHATQDDIARIIKQIQLRDERIMTAEAELRALREDVWRIQEDQRKLREDTLPAIRMAKDQFAPLPTPDAIEERPNPLSPTEPPSGGGHKSNLARKFSKKGLLLGSGTTTSRMTSPTIKEGHDLSPSAAALAASSHLTASMTSSQGPTSPTYSAQASPASPSFHSPNTTQPRSFWQSNHPSSTTPSNNNNNPTNIATSGGNPDSKTNSTPPSSATRPGQSTVPARRPVPSINTSQPPSTTSSAAPSSAVSSAPPSSAISGPSASSGNSGMDDAASGYMKSFRVGMEEPCSRVLPQALKKYNIPDDWRLYSLYIVHGDQERCLALDERPLILFKQLAQEGKKPMFMLRKHGAPATAQVDQQTPRASYADSMPLPGGVL